MKREYLRWGLAGLVLWLGYLAWLWQPERQVSLHQKHLIKAAERRNWNQVQRLMADDYADRWGGNKVESPAMAQEAFRHFLTLSIAQQGVEQEEGRITARLKLAGRGSPIADLIMERVNTLRAPFTFEWVHRSGRPWDWQLLRIEQPELDTTAPTL